ncbi:metallopeptidase family protein [Microbacterium sp. NPDC028030]|uniref:metallopeptidase family protein n=1 Tax=Microbacterium sp. NPDC028030 TaxID=3155124 RepID=UPI0033FC0BAA
MPRRRAAHASAAPRRGARHGRHGRLGRSEVVRPPLAPLDGRIDRFDLTVSTAVEFLRGTWPELQDVRFEIGAIPGFDATEEVPRWYLDREHGRIVLFRLPIERLLPPGHDDAAHRRMAIESAVFRAAAEYVGREPWDLGHEH